MKQGFSPRRIFVQYLNKKLISLSKNYCKLLLTTLTSNPGFCIIEGENAAPLKGPKSGFDVNNIRTRLSPKNLFMGKSRFYLLLLIVLTSASKMCVALWDCYLGFRSSTTLPSVWMHILPWQRRRADSMKGSSTSRRHPYKGLVSPERCSD